METARSFDTNLDGARLVTGDNSASLWAFLILVAQKALCRLRFFLAKVTYRSFSSLCKSFCKRRTGHIDSIIPTSLEKMLFVTPLMIRCPWCMLISLALFFFAYPHVVLQWSVNLDTVHKPLISFDANSTLLQFLHSYATAGEVVTVNQRKSWDWRSVNFSFLPSVSQRTTRSFPAAPFVAKSYLHSGNISPDIVPMRSYPLSLFFFWGDAISFGRDDCDRGICADRTQS